VSRLSNALLAALALHGLLLLTHAWHLPERPSLALSKPEELVEVEETLSDEASSAVATSASMQPAARGARAQPAAVAALAGARASEAETPADSLSGVEASPNGAASAEPGAASPADTAIGRPARKIDFGIDDGFFMRPASEALPRVPKPTFQRQLEAALSADDVRRGLARGGALLGSLNAAVRDKGPVRGEALLSVTVGPDGGLTAVEFLRGSASEWSSALESFRALAAHKRLRVPPGARGLRVTFSVQAKVQRPSGKEVISSGVDVEPSGLALRGTFDVADVGAGAQRLVYARVVSEEVL
jgi:hypothetical protein